MISALKLWYHFVSHKSNRGENFLVRHSSHLCEPDHLVDSRLFVSFDAGHNAFRSPYAHVPLGCLRRCDTCDIRNDIPLGCEICVVLVARNLSVSPRCKEPGSFLPKPKGSFHSVPIGRVSILEAVKKGSCSYQIVLESFDLLGEECNLLNVNRIPGQALAQGRTACRLVQIHGGSVAFTSLHEQDCCAECAFAESGSCFEKAQS